MALNRPEIAGSEERSRDKVLSGNDQIENSIAVVKELIQMGLWDKAEQLCLSTLKVTDGSPELRDLLAEVNSRFSQGREYLIDASVPDVDRMTRGEVSPKVLNGSRPSSTGLARPVSGVDKKETGPQPADASVAAGSVLTIDDIVADYAKRESLSELFSRNYFCCMQPGSYSAFGKNAGDIEG